MNKPFFSVIIPTYNRENLLPIAIDSVLRQSFYDYELIIVDDGSTDNTKEKLANFLSKEKIKYLYQPHGGVSKARNKGIKNSQGKYIAFLDSDDRFCQEKLAITHSYIQRYPDYKIFHTEEIWYRRSELLEQKLYHKKPHGQVFEKAIKSCCISISTAVIKKDVFKEVGSFDERLLACEDYDFWLRISSKFLVYLIPLYLTIKEGGNPDQQSKRYQAMDRYRIYAINKLLKTKELKEEYRLLAYEELAKKCLIYIKGALKRNKIKDAQYYQNLINYWSKERN
jgi:glycosyltransferase involved in cell wall biosynthesis